MNKKIHYRELLREYEGSGNPNNSIWFVGMEWADWWNEKEDPENYINKQNADDKIACTGKNFKTMFGNIGIIIKELGLAENNLLEKNGITYIDFKKDGDIFWTNTSLLAFKDSKDMDAHKARINNYLLKIDGLEGMDYRIFWNEEYFNIRKATFEKLIKRKPKFIFCIGKVENFYRLFNLLSIPINLTQINSIQVSYNAGRAKNSEVKFFVYNSLKIAVCPFFSMRWNNANEDLKRVCCEVQKML